MESLTLEQAVSRLNEIDIRAEKRKGTAHQLYDAAYNTIKAISDSDARHDMMETLHTYLYVYDHDIPESHIVRGKVYQFGEEDSPRLADDADVTDDLDEVYEFGKDLL